MALVVEDGSGLPDAEAYCSAADADEFHATRGNAAWAARSTEAKEQALRRATDDMLQQYSGRWKGERISASQALDWPRDGVVIDGFELRSDEVPAAVVRACAELALRALSGALTPDEGPGVKSKTVGPIEIVYQDGARDEKRYLAVENLLRPYLRGAASQITLVRA